MNQSRISCVAGFFVALLVGSVIHAVDKPTTLPAVEPIAQLKAGKVQGMFHLIYPGTARLGDKGHCALAVRVVGVGQMNLDDAGDFVFEADVRPGSYHIDVAPADEKNADYWPSERQQIHIDKEGHLYQMHDGWSKPGPFVLDRRMKNLSPENGEIAAAPAPVLKWPAVAGATHYRGDYSPSRWFGNWFDVDETQFVIGGGVAAGDGCMWRIAALDADGKILARGEAHFFGNGTDKADIADPQHPSGANVAPKQGADIVEPSVSRSYLGIQPLPSQVPKNPQTPIEANESGGYIVQDQGSGFIPGIFVARVVSDSPAIDAGLIPDDTIIAVDDQPVPSEGNEGDIEGFIKQISTMKAGTKITLTVRRFPRELTLHATVGLYPGAATQPAPTTVPVVPAEKVPAAAPESALVWTDVDAGSPVVSFFTAKPRAEIPLLSSKDGLASDLITSMAELPNGGMAFGSEQGLSIWDGVEIRTYTGPSYFGNRGPIDGNSGLPDNMIQDLLCDSRGRLWVATSFGVCRIDMAKSPRWRRLANPAQTTDVQRMFESSDGTIVLGARNSAITLIDPKTDKPTLVYHDQDMHHWITGIAEDSKHRLWFAVAGVGVLRYDGGKIEQVNGPWIVGTNPRGLAIDGAGTIWISNGEEGLSALHADGTTERVAADLQPGDYAQRLMTDRKGRLWVICNEGLAVHVTDDAKPAANGWKYADMGKTDYINGLLNAADGSWWIADGGARWQTELNLTETNPRAQAVNRLKQGIEKTWPNINADKRTAVMARGIAIGVADNRILRFDGKKWEDLSAQLGRHRVNQLFADSKGTIWVATGGEGLIGLDPAGGVRRFNNDHPGDGKCIIYSLNETPDGTLYAGTEHGVYRLSREKWEYVDSPLWQVGQVLADRNGRVWMMEVTYDKLYVYDGKRFREVKEQTAIADDPLVDGSMRLDAAGNVMVDIPVRPVEKVPRRTFKWNASNEGKIGPPVEVK